MAYIHVQISPHPSSLLLWVVPLQAHSPQRLPTLEALVSLLQVHSNIGLTYDHCKPFVAVLSLYKDSRGIYLGFADVHAFRSDLELARSVLRNNGQITSATTSVLPIGVGYLGWILDQSSDSLEKITIALEARVAAVWFSFGNDLEKWIRLVRDYDSKRTAPHKTLVFVLVNSVEEALKAAEVWKVDVLVVQGRPSSDKHSVYWLMLRR